MESTSLSRAPLRIAARIFHVGALLIHRLYFLLLWGVGLYYVVTLFADLRSDTTGITNTGFGILATLAALSFSLSRSTEPDQDRILYAGERFLHASLLLLGASLLRYAALSTDSQQALLGRPGLLQAIGDASGIVVGILFLWSLDFAHAGLTVLNAYLWARLPRYPDWKSVV